MPTSTATLISSQSRRGRGNSSVWRDSAAPWGGPAEAHVYVKKQLNYCCRPIWRGWRKTPLLQREFRALQACRALGLRVPDVMHFECAGQKATLVLAAVADALPLNQQLGATPNARRRILTNTGEYLGRLHGAGWYHGALYAHHILVGPGPEHTVCLIDFEKARRSRRRRAEDLQRFWRHNAYLDDSDRQTILSAYGAP